MQARDELEMEVRECVSQGRVRKMYRVPLVTLLE